MKYLHIFIAERSDKFSVPFINFVHENFCPEEHFFVKYNFPGNNKRLHQSNVLHLDSFSDYFKLLYLLIKAKKILFHAFNIQSSLMLFFSPFLFKKSYWLVWGGDLYYYRDRKNTFLHNIYYYFINNFIKNVYCMVTLLRADYELAQKWINTKAKYFSCFIYLSNVFSCPESNTKTRDDRTTILVGHSASISNHHTEVFEKIAKSKKDIDIRIICPLSYSETLEYRNLVIEQGGKMFGHCFQPIMEFLPFNEYLKALESVDIAIFNHDKPEAFSNIVNLLGMGKKVYLRADTNHYKYFKEIGVFIYDIDRLDLALIEETKKNRNIEIIKNHFSKDKLLADWNKLLNDV